LCSEDWRNDSNETFSQVNNHKHDDRGCGGMNYEIDIGINLIKAGRKSFDEAINTLIVGTNIKRMSF
jgi:hypothetical protein